jgi:hypothetical protein
VVSLRRAALALTASAALALAGAGSAGAVIIPQKSIAGAELLMSKSQVRGVLGDPKRVEHGTNDFGAYTVFYYGRLRVTFQGNVDATAVWTRRPRQKTPKGIGTGSTEQELKDAYPGAKCKTEIPGFRHCWTGSRQPGKRLTDYRIEGGEVSSVLVGIVID